MASKLRQIRRKPEGVKEGLPLIPNAGVAQALHKDILRLVNPMVQEFNALIKEYETEPVMDAMDAAPRRPSLRQRLDELSRVWNVRFEEHSQTIASKFSVKANEVSSRNVAMSLRSVGLKPTAERDQLWAADLREIANECAGLITNISQEYTSKIAQAVVESVAGGLSVPLAERVGELGHIVGRRASNISRDQNSKAYSELNARKMMRAGVKRYIWRHSSAGKKPRPSHVAAHGDIYEYGDPNVPAKATSRWDIGPPGMCINCRCYAVPIVEEDW